VLFHYHFWTPFVEETERFYGSNGFRVSLRIGKHKGNFETFNPPLTWSDFREKNIVFRIIEMRKGAVNITFGYGKKIMFDHIGFLVSEEEHDRICHNANKMNWEVDIGDRRTFIAIPYGFRIELQMRKEVVDNVADDVKLHALKIATKTSGLERDLSFLFGKSISSISSVVGDEVTIQEAAIEGFLQTNAIDPNGVKIT